MSRIVISQPMFLPWLGLFEQMNMADFYIHYDDVQMPLGRSFMNRVQIKTQDGVKWMTVPVKSGGKQLICDVEIDNSQDWKSKHLKMVRYNYSKCRYFDVMFQLMSQVYGYETDSMCDFNINAIETICKEVNINPVFQKSSDLNIGHSSSKKLLEIVIKLNGQTYITGHGAKNYIDYALFEENHIAVYYMDYACREYSQMHGAFTPYVSIIDIIANVGLDLDDYLKSSAIYWKDLMDA